MDARDYQRAVARTAAQIDKPISTENAAVLRSVIGLCGESGELLDEVKKVTFHGHAPDWDRVKKELGDVAWYLAQTCTDLGVNLSDVMQANVDKLMRRYPDGFTSADSVRRADVNEAQP